MPSAARYADMSRRLIRQARGELESGDLMQASKKAWGAAAHFLKSVAERRGLRYESDEDLIEAASNAKRALKTPEYSDLIIEAVAMNANIHENWLSESQIRQGIDSIAALLERLEGAEI